MMKLPQQPLAIVQRAATRQVVRQFARKFDFVYFGHVDPQRDEQQIICGITASAAHTDRHFAFGSFRGRDIAVVERQNTLHFPGKGTHTYRWLIMQFDLHDAHPHAFMDAHHHEEIFYANLFTKHGQLDDVTARFAAHDSLFATHFKVFARSQDAERVHMMLTPAITAMLAHHFKQFDYEIADDSLYIYASNAVIALSVVQEMLRVGVWLVEQLDAQKRFKGSVG